MLRSAVLGLLCGFILCACSGGGGGGGSSSGGGGGNAPPTIIAQSFSGTEDAVLSGQLAASDPGDTLTYVAAANPMAGAVTLTTAGAFTYTPNNNFSGADTFTARVTDGASQSATATITLNMAAVNDAPTTANDILTVTSTSALDVLANDGDPDNDVLAVSITSAPLVGTATVNANRTINVALPAGFRGFTKFGYRVTDAANVTADATALLFVGISPFKVVTLSPPAGGSAGGIFVNDLLTTRLAHEAGIGYADIDGESMRVSRNGRSLVYKYNGANGLELRYVDLHSPGQSRLVHGPLTGAQKFGWLIITPDGRFVVYEYMPEGNSNHQQLNVFDRDGAGPAQRLSGPEAEQPLARIGPFNAAGTAMYYPGMTATQLPWMSAVYRVDLATRVATRVSIENYTQTSAYLWPLPNDSSYVDVRFFNAGGMSAYVTNNAAPAGATRLHEPLGSPNVYYPADLSPDGSYFVFTEANLNFGPVRMAVSRTASPGSSQTVGGPTFATNHQVGYPIMRADSQAMVVDRYPLSPGISGIYEVPLASPGTVTTVYETADAYLTLSVGGYSSDGERIIYWVQTPGSGFQLAVTRRGAFGQSMPIAPAADSAIAAFDLDASGCVVLVSGSGSPATAALVNVDMPMTPLPVGTTSHTFYGLAIRPR